MQYVRLPQLLQRWVTLATIKLELEMEIATSTTHKAALTSGKVSSGFSTVIKKQTVSLSTSRF
ncbi:MAG: hypothetical protein CM15mV52_0060 [uncultured marine virus]|nr:MAG: hypothetical protein CM15mV52_0060 [uncultured marine virus]